MTDQVEMLDRVVAMGIDRRADVHHALDGHHRVLDREPAVDSERGPPEASYGVVVLCHSDIEGEPEPRLVGHAWGDAQTGNVAHVQPDEPADGGIGLTPN